MLGFKINGDSKKLRQYRKINKVINARQLGKNGQGVPCLGLEYTDNNATVARSKASKDIGIYGAAGEAGGGYAFCGDVADGGDGAEIHEIGRGANGEIISSSHLTTNTLFKTPNRNRSKFKDVLSKLDAPIHFEEVEVDWNGIPSLPERMRTHCNYDHNLKHKGPYGEKNGKWVFWTEAPFKDPSPPPWKPPWFPTPPLDPPPGEDFPPFPPDPEEPPPDGVPPGGVEWDGKGKKRSRIIHRPSKDDRKRKPKQKKPWDVEWWPWKPIRPRKRKMVWVDGGKPGLPPGGHEEEKEDPWNHPYPPKPRGEQDWFRPHPFPWFKYNGNAPNPFNKGKKKPIKYVSSRFYIGGTVLTGKPNPSIGPNISDLDFERVSGRARIENEWKIKTPIVGRLESFGGHDKVAWKAQKTVSSNDKSRRHIGGTGPGGFVFMPPEMDLAEVRKYVTERNIDPPKIANNEVSRTHWIFTPGTSIAWGWPDLVNGTLRSGVYAEIDLGNVVTYYRKEVSGAVTPILTFPATPGGNCLVENNLDLGGGTNFRATLNMSNITADRTYTLRRIDGPVWYGDKTWSEVLLANMHAGGTYVCLLAIPDDFHSLVSARITFIVGALAGVPGQTMTITTNYGDAIGGNQFDFGSSTGPISSGIFSGKPPDGLATTPIGPLLASAAPGQFGNVSVTLGGGFIGSLKGFATTIRYR